MAPFLELALALMVIILAAKAGGYLSYRLGQPSVLGELIAGLILGPSVLNFLHLPFFAASDHLGQTIGELAELGVLLLMFMAGLDLHISDLARSGKVSALAGTLGVVFPVVMGYILGIAVALTQEQAIFVGLSLAATSVSISAQTLMELQVLRSRVGISLLGAAVFDDVLVVLGLSLFLALLESSGATAGLEIIIVVVLRMVGFLLLATVAGFYLLPARLSRRIDRLPISQGLLAFVFVILLLYGWLAEIVGGMTAITGAFLAGLIFARSPFKSRIATGVATISYAIFVPIFFVHIGLVADLRDFSGENLLFLTAAVVVAVISKVLGAGLGGRLGGLTSRESLQLGVGMMSRGEVGLIVVTVGVTSGLVPPEVFTVIVGVVILTTLLTPPLLRALFSGQEAVDMPPQQPVKGESSS